MPSRTLLQELDIRVRHCLVRFWLGTIAIVTGLVVNMPHHHGRPGGQLPQRKFPQCTK